MEPAALVKLRELLEGGQIDEAMFTLLSVGASARIEGAGAVAQGDGAQAAGEGGVAIAGNSTAPIHAGTHLHLHAGPPPPAAAQPASLRRDYLRRVWKQTDSLSLLSGGDTQRPVRLGAVYTALMTELRTDTEPTRARGRLPSAAALGGERELPLSAVAALNQHDRLVLLGGPGSGKSTFIHYVAQCMAGALLGRDAATPGPHRGPGGF